MSSTYILSENRLRRTLPCKSRNPIYPEIKQNSVQFKKNKKCETRIYVKPECPANGA